MLDYMSTTFTAQERGSSSVYSLLAKAGLCVGIKARLNDVDFNVSFFFACGAREKSPNGYGVMLLSSISLLEHPCHWWFESTLVRHKRS